MSHVVNRQEPLRAQQTRVVGVVIDHLIRTVQIKQVHQLRFPIHKQKGSIGKGGQRTETWLGVTIEGRARLQPNEGLKTEDIQAPCVRLTVLYEHGEMLSIGADTADTFRVRILDDVRHADGVLQVEARLVQLPYSEGLLVEEHQVVAIRGDGRVLIVGTSQYEVRHDFHLAAVRVVHEERFLAKDKQPVHGVRPDQIAQLSTHVHGLQARFVVFDTVEIVDNDAIFPAEENVLGVRSHVAVCGVEFDLLHTCPLVRFACKKRGEKCETMWPSSGLPSELVETFNLFVNCCNSL